jgi:hydroxymethylglutaryl-CoA lyase
MDRPQINPDTGLPARVLIREVGPRDGFQNEPELIPTDDKVALIEQLAATGVPRMELTSFVRADIVPQLADGPEVLARLRLPERLERSVIVPTPRGLELALEHSEYFDDVNVFLSASESHNRANVNRSVAESLSGLQPMLARIADAGLRPRASISTAFGCPYEGRVPEERVAELSVALVDAGAVDLNLADTTGMANPLGVKRVFAAIFDRLGDRAELTAHFHNTRGAGLANVVAALEVGVTSFDSSFGELGGCPVPPGATGNIATEDLVSMLHEMGVQTGIDLEGMIAASAAVQRILGRPLTSHTLVAGPISWS